jgi:peptidoglycan/LPS O-acetylase OafA/YrhL
MEKMAKASTSLGFLCFFIYVTSPLLTYRPEGKVEIYDLIPSVTLIPPRLLYDIGIPSDGFTDGVLWSLVAEVFFYFMAALFYFVFKDKSLFGLTLFYVFYVATLQIIQFVGIEATKESFFSPILGLLNLLDYYYVFKFGWFLIGIYIYNYFKLKESPTSSTKIKTYLYLIPIMLTLLMATNSKIDPKHVAFYPLVLLIFLIPFFFQKIQSLLSAKYLVFIGIISYPLYLIHQNVSVGLASQIHIWFDFIPVEALPIIPIIIVVIIAFYFEKLDRKIKPHINKVGTKLKLN